MTEQLLLIRPAAEHEKDISAYKAEFLINGDSMDGTAGLRNAPSATEWIVQIALNESGRLCDSDLCLPPHFLPFMP